MIAEVYDEKGNFVSMYEIDSVYSNLVGGFLVWIIGGEFGQMHLREGDKVDILTTTGKHLKTIVQSNSKGV